MDAAHINRLKEYFGFMPINPTTNFYEHPCAGTLSNIPKAVQTEEMVFLALENEEPYASPVLKYTAKRLKTDEVCDKAVSANVLNFLYTPEEYRTTARCFDAVSRDSGEVTGERALLSAVPENVLKGALGSEMCAAAVVANWRSLSFVPKEYINPKMLMDAAEAIPKGYSLCDVTWYFPRQKLTKTLSVAIMRQSGEGYDSLPPRFKKDKDVIDAAISSYPDVVMELADEQLTEERLHRALELDDTLLRRLPDEILDRFGIEHPAMRLRRRTRLPPCRKSVPLSRNCRRYPELPWRRPPLPFPFSMTSPPATTFRTPESSFTSPTCTLNPNLA